MHHICHLSVLLSSAVRRSLHVGDVSVSDVKHTTDNDGPCVVHTDHNADSDVTVEVSWYDRPHTLSSPLHTQLPSVLRFQYIFINLANTSIASLLKMQMQCSKTHKFYFISYNSDARVCQSQESPYNP